jgi:cell division protein FtsB
MTRATVQRLFDWKVRGIRWIEIIGVVLVAAMIFSVYVAKAAAARESAQISQLERQIAETRQRVRLLRAEAARLEQPARLEALSRGAGLAPVEMDRQADGVALSTLKPAPQPVAAPVEAAPAAVEATPDVATDAAPVAEGLR